MRAITITGSTLVRIALVAGFIGLSLMCLGLTAVLAFAGYLMFALGMTKVSLFVWGAAWVPLVFLGVMGSLLSDRIRPLGTFTATHTGTTP